MKFLDLQKNEFLKIIQKVPFFRGTCTNNSLEAKSMASFFRFASTNQQFELFFKRKSMLFGVFSSFFFCLAWDIRHVPKFSKIGNVVKKKWLCFGKVCQLYFAKQYCFTRKCLFSGKVDFFDQKSQSACRSNGSIFFKIWQNERFLIRTWFLCFTPTLSFLDFDKRFRNQVDKQTLPTTDVMVSITLIRYQRRARVEKVSHNDIRMLHDSGRFHCVSLFWCCGQTDQEK